MNKANPASSFAGPQVQANHLAHRLLHLPPPLFLPSLLLPPTPLPLLPLPPLPVVRIPQSALFKVAGRHASRMTVHAGSVASTASTQVVAAPRRTGKLDRLLSLFPPTLLLQPCCPLLRDMAHKLSHHPQQLLPTTSPLNPSTHSPTHASHHTSFPFTSSRWHASKHSSSPRANLMLNASLAPSKLYKRLLYMLGGLIMLNPKAVNYKKGLHGPS